jgi:hypothetical protein
MRRLTRASGTGVGWSRALRIGLAFVLAAPAMMLGAAPPIAPQPEASPVARPAPRLSGDRGETSYRLEAQARKVTTRFADVVVESRRAIGGTIETRVTDVAGNELAAMSVETAAAEVRAIHFTAADARRLHAAAPANARATLEWGNRQAYGLFKDFRGGRDSQLDWVGGVGRPRGAAARDFGRESIEVRTEWNDAMESRVKHRDGRRRHVLTGQPINGHALVGVLMRNGVEVGSSGWFPEEETFQWTFPGLTEGYVDPARLTEVGGWPFTPDVEWLAVQNYAFHSFHTLMKEQGSVAKRSEGIVQKLAAMLMPAVQANEPGCDGLHWFDYSIFRPCCDSHDLCYERSGCSSRSWWQWWSSWQCDGCNLRVVVCFSAAGIAPYRQFPYYL